MGVADGAMDAADNSESALRSFLVDRNKETRAALISCHISLVESIARQFFSKAYGEPLEDLIQVGTVGLIKAVDHFDPEREARFTTYATHAVTGEIRHYLRDRANLIRPPRWLSFLNYKINNEAEKLAQQLKRQPTAKEIADSLNIKVEGVEEVLKLRKELSSVSLDQQALGKNFERVQQKIHSQQLMNFQMPIEDKLVLLSALDKLVLLQRKAIHLFFYYDLTQGEIGKYLGLSQRSVSRVIQHGLVKLKEILTKELW